MLVISFHHIKTKLHGLKTCHDVIFIPIPFPFNIVPSTPADVAASTVQGSTHPQLTSILWCYERHVLLTRCLYLFLNYIPACPSALSDLKENNQLSVLLPFPDSTCQFSPNSVSLLNISHTLPQSLRSSNYFYTPTILRISRRISAIWLLRISMVYVCIISLPYQYNHSCSLFSWYISCVKPHDSD